MRYRFIVLLTKLPIIINKNDRNILACSQLPIGVHHNLDFFMDTDIEVYVM